MKKPLILGLSTIAAIIVFTLHAQQAAQAAPTCSDFQGVGFTPAQQQKLCNGMKQPVWAQWPTAAESGTTPKPFQDPTSVDVSKTFSIPYEPHFALVSWISVRNRGSNAGDETIHTPVLVVPTGQTWEFPAALCMLSAIPSANDSPSVKITLQGKTLRLQHGCVGRPGGGYPAFSIEFLP